MMRASTSQHTYTCACTHTHTFTDTETVRHNAPLQTHTSNLVDLMLLTPPQEAANGGL